MSTSNTNFSEVGNVCKRDSYIDIPLPCFHTMTCTLTAQGEAIVMKAHRLAMNLLILMYFIKTSIFIIKTCQSEY